MDRSAASLRAAEIALIVLTAGVVLGFILRSPVFLGANDNSRWDTIWSLVERGTYVIDEAPFATIDKVQRDGHFYSSKPPLLPTILAGVAWAIKTIGRFELCEQPRLVGRIILVLVNLAPLIVYLELYRRLLGRFGFAPATRLYCLAAAAGATYLTGYCATLNNHTVAAFSAFFALCCLLRIRYDQKRQAGWFAAAGFFAAFAGCNDLPALALTLAVLVYLVRLDRERTLRWFLPAASVPVAAFLVTNYLATGGLLPYYAYTDSALYHYEGSYWNAPHGIDKLTQQPEPRWLYLVHMLVGHHGVFSLTPVFVLGAISVVQHLRGRLQTFHAFRLLLPILLAVALGVYLLAPHRNYGGVCQGLRWLFWLIPLWMIMLPPIVDRCWQYRSTAALAWLLLGISAMSAAYAVQDPWSRSWLHELLHALGVVPY